jgi:hypothetical protein
MKRTGHLPFALSRGFDWACNASKMTRVDVDHVSKMFGQIRYRRILINSGKIWTMR